MRKYTALLIAVVIAIVCAVSLVMRRPAKRLVASMSPSSAPGTMYPNYTAQGPGVAWFGARTTGGGRGYASKEPRGVYQMGPVEHPMRVKQGSRAPYSSRPLRTATALPSFRPETTPPYTLGPVPNGITRTPEPPAVDLPSEANIIIPQLSGGYASVFEDPAPRNSGSANGSAIPAVQNPWDVQQWRFLVGQPVGAAISIINEQFPSFPVAKRHVQAGPGMSGAVTLRFDNSGKVVSVVRD